MSDPVEDGVRLLRDYFITLPDGTNDELRVIVRNIIAPAVQAERERIRTGVVALTPLWATALDRWVYLDSDVLAVIDGGSDA